MRVQIWLPSCVLALGADRAGRSPLQVDTQSATPDYFSGGLHRVYAVRYQPWTDIAPPSLLALAVDADADAVPLGRLVGAVTVDPSRL